MAEYINRDEFLAQYTGNILTAKVDYAEGMRDVIQDIKNAPVADVVPVVYGHWIKKEKYSNDSGVVCSECKMEFDYIDGVCYLVSGSELPHYCPSCGTKMDLED